MLAQGIIRAVIHTSCRENLHHDRQQRHLASKTAEETENLTKIHTNICIDLDDIYRQKNILFGCFISLKIKRQKYHSEKLTMVLDHSTRFICSFHSILDKQSYTGQTFFSFCESFQVKALNHNFFSRKGMWRGMYRRMCRSPH